MSGPRRHATRAAFFLAALLALWLLTTEPWGLGVFQLVVFTAPGALLGLAAGWMANATTQSSWTWTDGRRAAIRGALIMPPVLVFLIALDGNDRPTLLLEGFVRAAWLALAVGAATALTRALRRPPDEIRGRAEDPRRTPIPFWRRQPGRRPPGSLRR